jgi:hypothetical protein
VYQGALVVDVGDRKQRALGERAAHQLQAEWQTRLFGYARGNGDSRQACEIGRRGEAQQRQADGLDRQWVGCIEAGDDLQAQRRVGHAACQRTNVIDGGVVRSDQTPRADPPMVGFRPTMPHGDDGGWSCRR